MTNKRYQWEGKIPTPFFKIEGPDKCSDTWICAIIIDGKILSAGAAKKTQTKEDSEKKIRYNQNKYRDPFAKYALTPQRFDHYNIS
jgi:hypothetical protein